MVTERRAGLAAVAVAEFGVDDDDALADAVRAVALLGCCGINGF